MTFFAPLSGMMASFVNESKRTTTSTAAKAVAVAAFGSKNTDTGQWVNG
jgi:hypothetical protein